MIDQAGPHIQGTGIIRHRSAALSLPSGAGLSFFFKAMVVVIAAVAALAI